MNQTPASILVLASSVFGFAAVRDSSAPQTILVLASVVIGFWGVLAMVGAVIRERELLIDNHARLDVFDRFFQRDPGPAAARPKTRQSAPDRSLEVPPELHAQIKIVAEMEGRDRSEVLEEALRRHLPKYSKSRVA